AVCLFRADGTRRGIGAAFACDAVLARPESGRPDAGPSASPCHAGGQSHCLAATRVQAAGVLHDARRPAGDAHHVAAIRVGIQLCPSVLCYRRSGLPLAQLYLCRFRLSPDSFRAVLWLYLLRKRRGDRRHHVRMIHRAARTLRSLWVSMAFSLTLTYGLLAVVTTLVLLAFVYLQTVGVLHRQIYSQNTTRALYLANEFEQGGQQAVIDAINHALDDHMEVVQQIFLYLDADGNKLAGNLDESPDLPGPDLPVSEVLTSPDGTEIHGRVQSIVLPDASVVI